MESKKLIYKQYALPQTAASPRNTKWLKNSIAVKAVARDNLALFTTVMAPPTTLIRTKQEILITKVNECRHDPTPMLNIPTSAFFALYTLLSVKENPEEETCRLMGFIVEIFFLSSTTNTIFQSLPGIVLVHCQLS